MTLIVIVTLRDGALDAFRAFETRAASIMAKHGGAIERTVVVPPRDAGDATKEVHLVTFPNDAAFAAYRNDDSLRALAPLRESAVASTEILIGEDGPNYAALADAR